MERKEVADLLVTSKNGRPVLVVKVKMWKSRLYREEWLDQLDKLMRAFKAPFGALITPEEGVFCQRHFYEIAQVLRVPMHECIKHYHPMGLEKVHIESFLVAILEEWLRDLTKSDKSAPLKEELQKVGLLRRIKGGEVAVEVEAPVPVRPSVL